MGPSTDSTSSTALVRRLATVREVLGLEERSPDDLGADLMDSLVELVEVANARRDPAVSWLLVVGLTAALPEPGLVRSVTRALVLREPEDGAAWLLGAVAPLAMRFGNGHAGLRVVTDRPLVDVGLSAKSDFLTGIQRVVRGVVSEWHERHDVEFVVPAERDGAYRALLPAERSRLLQRMVGRFTSGDQAAIDEGDEIVVPWGVPLVLTEVPPAAMCDRLAAVAELTETSVRLVGYDCIPVASPETVPLAEPEKFGRYLELVKFSDRLAAISVTAAAEFEGFGRALVAQGLQGPRVSACLLPHTTPMTAEAVVPPAPIRPVVLCVGTVGRRKNQVALVEAAEVLWREGLEFELRVFGHLAAERTPFADLVAELVAIGRPLVVESGVADARIAETLDEARCLVFPSLHEGFGLPLVEALTHGVPVLTSDFGSTREVAEHQGGLLVDPEGPDALADALRALLVDDVLHARLVGEARRRPIRTWHEYAVDLWETLIA